MVGAVEITKWVASVILNIVVEPAKAPVPVTIVTVAPTERPEVLVQVTFVDAKAQLTPVIIVLLSALALTVSDGVELAEVFANVTGV